MDGMAGAAASLTAEDLGALRSIAGNRRRGYLPQRPYVGGGLPHLFLGHRTRARHLGATNSVLENFQQRGVIARVPELGPGQHRSAPAFTLRPMAARALVLK